MIHYTKNRLKVPPELQLSAYNYFAGLRNIASHKIKKSYKAALKIAFNGLSTKYTRKIRKCTEFTEDLKQDLHFKEILNKRKSYQ